MDSLEWPRQWKMDMMFGTWHVRSLYRAGSLKTVACKLAKYNLDPVAAQEVRQDKVGSQPAVTHLYTEMGVLIIS
jgi:hypothetical protein